MKRIGIEVNGVLRDTIEKFKQVYEKQLIDNQNEFKLQTYKIDMSGNTEEETLPDPFEYKIIDNTISSLDLLKHFSFQNNR